MKRAATSLRSVAHPVGLVVTAMGALLAACAGLGVLIEALHPVRLRAPERAWEVAACACAVVIVGLLTLRTGRNHRASITSRREATLAVGAIWVVASVVGGLPLMIAADMRPAAALFEAVSGLTTTGATALADIEGTLGRGLLLWRSSLNWLGGMGIVVLFVAVFPSVGAGGKHMFQGEVTGATSDALTPRIRDTSFALWKIYATMTAVLIALLVALGMDPFEAVCHAFATISTGGFSPRDASIAYYASPAIEVTIAVFMLASSLNFALFFGVVRTRSLRGLWRNVEVRVFAWVTIAATTLVTVGTLHLHKTPLEALRHAFFMVSTFMSSTGFVSTDHAVYPPPVIGLVLFLMLMGGCSGSTAGGLKVERMILLVKHAASRIRRSYRPNVVDVVRVGRQPVTGAVLEDVGALFFIYIVTLIAGAVLLTLSERVDLTTALGAILTSVSNMGPAPYYKTADNFAGYSAAGHVVCSIAMVLGRLEFFTLLALMTPTFWRR